MNQQQAEHIRQILRERLPLDGRRAKRHEMTAARFSIEILGKSKDYIREFLVGDKESLDAPSLAKIEDYFRLPNGSLFKHGVTDNFAQNLAGYSATPLRRADPQLRDEISRVPLGSEFGDDYTLIEDERHFSASSKVKRNELKPGEVPERNVVAGLGQGGLADPVYIEGQVLDGVRAIWRVPEDYLRTELRARESEVDILAVDGDSMQPTLVPGDRVIVNRSQTAPSPDGLFAIFDGVGISIKRLQVIKGSNPLQIRIISDNPQHSTDTIEASDLHIIGRVICKITRL